MDKIKAVNPNIIVRGSVDKPYYLIEYYDLSDNEWYIGYGSYYLANVKKWLKTYFEVTNADVAPVKHGCWWCECNPDNSIKHIGCSVCDYKISKDGIIPFVAIFDFKYCPNCGTKMDKDKGRAVLVTKEGAAVSICALVGDA